MKRGGGPLKRRAPLRKRNPQRRARLHSEQFGPQSELARNSHCVACGSPPPCDPAHVRSRAAGGTDADVVPLCRPCHLRQHGLGIKTFQARMNVDLAAEAARLAKEVERGE